MIDENEDFKPIWTNPLISLVMVNGGYLVRDCRNERIEETATMSHRDALQIYKELQRKHGRRIDF